MLGFVLRNWRLIASALAIVAALGGLGGIYLKIRHDAYQDGYRRAQTECAAEKAAMEAANNKAIAEAEEKLEEAERKLAETEVKLEDYINALDLIADEADGATDVCLFAPGVRRLDAIR